MKNTEIPALIHPGQLQCAGENNRKTLHEILESHQEHQSKPGATEQKIATSTPPASTKINAKKQERKPLAPYLERIDKVKA